MKLRNILLGGILSVSLIGCVSVKPFGYMEASYVPVREAGELHKDELKGELGAGFDFNLGNGFNLEWGNSVKSYVNYLGTSFGGLSFCPDAVEYDAWMDLTKGDFDFFLKHYCLHPVGEDTKGIYTDGNFSGYINSGQMTEAGVRIKIK